MAGLIGYIDEREVIRLATRQDFSVPAVEGRVDITTVKEAIERLAFPPPMKEQDPELSSAKARQIEARLKPIGAKIDPKIDAEQAFAWRKAVVLALSDLPANVVIEAAARAVHRPMQFLNEVDGVVREEALKVIHERKVIIARLEALKRAIERAQNQQPQLAAEPMVWTQADVDLANESFRKTGLKIRYRIGADGEVENYESSADEREAERQETTKIDPDENVR